MKILVTGGAGFIGGHLVDSLVAKGHDVTILDNLSGNDFVKPTYLNPSAKLIVDNVSNQGLLSSIIGDFDVVFHLAAKVGVAQSNYEIFEYAKENCLGNSCILQSIVDSKKPIKLIVATSNTTYGEGIYNCLSCKTAFHPSIRAAETVRAEGLEIRCKKCGQKATPMPTPEDTRLDSNSIYALTKKFQEESALMVGKMYGFPVVAVKFFNVFGQRQSLSNPYTGVSAIFTTRIKSGNPVVIYEDGLQTRDLIHVSDVVSACVLVMERKEANNNMINIGSGKPTTMLQLAKLLYNIFGEKENIQITNAYRKGDIRHCTADISKARRLLGWEPKMDLESGIRAVFEWAKNETAEDRFNQAQKELEEKKLI